MKVCVEPWSFLNYPNRLSASRSSIQATYCGGLYTEKESASRSVNNFRNTAHTFLQKFKINYLGRVFKNNHSRRKIITGSTLENYLHRLQGSSKPQQTLKYPKQINWRNFEAWDVQFVVGPLYLVKHQIDYGKMSQRLNLALLSNVWQKIIMKKNWTELNRKCYNEEQFYIFISCCFSPMFLIPLHCDVKTTGVWYENTREEFQNCIECKILRSPIGIRYKILAK